MSTEEELKEVGRVVRRGRVGRGQGVVFEVGLGFEFLSFLRSFPKAFPRSFQLAETCPKKPSETISELVMLYICLCEIFSRKACPRIARVPHPWSCRARGKRVGAQEKALLYAPCQPAYLPVYSVGLSQSRAVVWIRQVGVGFRLFVLLARRSGDVYPILWGSHEKVTCGKISFKMFFATNSQRIAENCCFARARQCRELSAPGGARCHRFRAQGQQ